MEQRLHNPEVYDFRQHDRIWQRIAPGLEPYPTPRQMSSGAESNQNSQTIPAQTGQNPSTQTQLLPTGTGDPGLTPLQLRQESELPGADVDPCCMGSAAAEMLAVLTGFIEEELADQRYYQALACRAPSWARQRLRDIGAEEGAHAQRLMAIHYLITGECYHPDPRCDRIYIGSWCAALRQRYHEEACGGLNYERAAEGTTDPCLSRLLSDLSADEYRHADTILRILEKSLRKT